MLKTQLVLPLTKDQLADLQMIILQARTTGGIICGSIDIDDYKSIKLAVVERKTALEIEKLANTEGENNAEEK